MPPAAERVEIKNVFTVDVEEHFQVEAFQSFIPQESWRNRQSRLALNLVKLLDILDQYHTRATFFVLGWVADRHPHLVAMIHSRGHELASHGYSHVSIKRMSPQQFCEDLERSLTAIERACGVSVKGYRAPTFSAERDKEWIWETLLQAGIEYDSSIYPVRHDLYGDPSAPRHPYFMSFAAGAIFEIPPTTYRFCGKSIPACGGGSFRMFPYWFTKRAIAAYNREGHAAVVYIHPWELDPTQPREKVDARGRFRHYTNLHRVEAKLRRLLSDYDFGAIADVYPDLPARYEKLADRGVNNG